MNSAVLLLERAAERFPDRVAVEDEWESATYAAYRERSRRVGTGLLRAGADRRPVVVCLPKSYRALTVFMGAQYAGSPYVPVDYAIPMARLRKIIESLSPCVAVTDAAGKEKLSAEFPDLTVLLYDGLALTEADDEAIGRGLSRVIDADPVYIIYTSGSTGTPKGVTIPHRGILHYVRWLAETFRFHEGTVLANQAPFYFDNSVFDVYGSLQCGGKLLITPEALFRFPLKLPEFLRDKRVTAFLWVPTVMMNVANSGALAKEKQISLPALETVCFAGEVMPNKQLNIWRAALPGCTFANLYGPTETDVCCCYIVDRPYADSEPLPIGRAIGNLRTLVLTEDGRQAETGETGELCVAGSGIALGYWNAPELTARSFLSNPLRTAFPERMYKTGDLAYETGEGLLMFCGRRDFQIKRKGNRIELGEIEAAAMCVEGVKNAAALFDPGPERIILYVETPGTLPFRRFNQVLKEYIPAYMLPDALVPMEKLPYTPNGKIDRVGLRGLLEKKEN